MNFLYPAFLFGALAIAVPIVLHLLRRDVAPDVPFTAVRLLRKSPVERSRRRRIRDLLLLAARVTALLLLASAFARPYLPRAEASSGTLRIVAVDRSFSMGAPGRFDRALALARAAIDEAGFGERVALIAFDERADVLALPGGAGDARAALKGVAPGYRATRYASVLERAAEIASGGTARLLIVTDLQRAGWEGETRTRVPASLSVEVRDAGAPAGNVAIAAVGVDESGVAVTVRNASHQPRQGTVAISHESTVIARSSYTAPADSTADVRVAWPDTGRPSAGSVAVAIDDPSGFPADDRRFALVRKSGAPTVMVITSGEASGFFFLRALDAAGSALEIRQVSAAEIAGGRAKEVAGQAGIVLLSTRNLDRSAREAIVAYVRGGGGLFIAAAPEVEPAVVTTMFGWDTGDLSVDPSPRQVTLTATDIRHPIFRPFGTVAANLGQVRFRQTWRVRPGGWHVPARFSDGSSAVLDRSEGAGRVVIFASDVDKRWNDFPLHPAFVPFSVESVRYLAARHGETEDLLVSRVPAGVHAAPGVQKLPDGRPVAVNVDTRESSTVAMTPAEFGTMIEPVAAPIQAARDGVRAEQAEARQTLWRYGLMLMLLTLVVESFVGRA